MNALHNDLQLWRPGHWPRRYERRPSDYTATMWLNKYRLLQPDDVIVYCIQSTQHYVSQAGGLYATLGRDNYLWPVATRLINSHVLPVVVPYLLSSCLPLHCIYPWCLELVSLIHSTSLKSQRRLFYGWNSLLRDRGYNILEFTDSLWKKLLPSIYFVSNVKCNTFDQHHICKIQ